MIKRLFWAACGLLNAFTLGINVGDGDFGGWFFMGLLALVVATTHILLDEQHG